MNFSKSFTFILIVFGMGMAFSVFGQSSRPPISQKPPRAEAGLGQTVNVGDTVVLDASASSDEDGDRLTYAWSLISKPKGSEAIILNPTKVRPRILVDQEGTYVAQLVVNDGTEDSAPDKVEITTDNSPPVANAGLNQKVSVGDTVRLDGSGSLDIDGDTLEFYWVLLSKPDGSTGTLSDPTVINPTFEIDQLGTYVAQLTVHDGEHTSQPATVSITTENSPPIANAGPDQTTKVGDVAALDGSNSTDREEGTNLTFFWSLLAAPSGSSAEISDQSTPNPNLQIDRPGTYVAQLIVSDGMTESVPSHVVISTENSRPVANAGPDRTAMPGETVGLEGRDSFDADGDPLQFQWSFLAVPEASQVEFSDSQSSTPSLIPKIPGIYIAQLIISDGHLRSHPDTVMIAVNPAPKAEPFSSASDFQVAPELFSAGNFTEMKNQSSLEANSLAATGICPEGTPLIFTGRFHFSTPQCTLDSGRAEIASITKKDTVCIVGAPPPPPVVPPFPPKADLNLGDCNYDPLRGARVELAQDLGIPGPSAGDVFLTSTATDQFGLFAFCGNVSSTNNPIDFYVSVRTCADGSENGDACGTRTGTPVPFSVVVATPPPTSEVYTTNSPVTVEDVCTGSVQWDMVDRRANHNGAQHIFNKLANEAFDFLEREVGFRNEFRGQVRFPQSPTGFSTTNERVQIAAGDEQDPDVILRTHSFSTLFQLYNKSFPAVSAACASSEWGIPSDPTCAWINGAATFLQAAIQNDRIFLDTSSDGITVERMLDLETPSPPVVGEDDEGSVAATLWDIFDTNAENWDAVSLGFPPIWEIIKKRPSNICEFVKLYNSSSPSNPDISLILAQHNISCASINSVEVTQAIQELQSLKALKADLANDGEPPVPIIAGKPAAMRLYFNKVQDVTPVRAALTIPNVIDFRTPLRTLQPQCTPELFRTREMGCNSIDFYFIPPKGQWTAKLVLFNKNNAELERHEFSFKSRNAEPLVLSAVRVCDSQKSSGEWQCENNYASRLANLSSFLRKIAPTDRVSVVDSGETSEQDTAVLIQDSNMNGKFDVNEVFVWWDAVRKDIDGYFSLFDLVRDGLGLEDRRYYGISRSTIPGSILGIAAGIPSRGAVSLATARNRGIDVSQDTVAHETGHMLGRLHTNTDVPNSACAPSSIGANPPQWPFVDNQLRSGSGVIETGFDVAIGRPVPGDKNYEVMSYCIPVWISPFTYNGILINALDKPLSSAKAVSRATIVEDDFWALSGSIVNNGAAFDPLYKLKTLGSSDEGQGTHSIEIIDTTGTILFRRAFTPVKPEVRMADGAFAPSTFPSFFQIIPVQELATRILLRNEGSMLIGEVPLEGFAPEVKFTLPIGGENLIGKNPISWITSDQDGGIPRFWVQYSPDNGIPGSWRTLGRDLTDLSLIVDFDKLPGTASQSRLRILATDGANASETVSEPFTVGTKPPMAGVVFPEDNQVFRAGDMVWLQGQAFDPDDGALQGPALSWESDIDGILGEGESLPLTSLSVGTHQITFVATDSEGNTATDSIKIIVAGPPPILNLSATPEQILSKTCVRVTIDAQVGDESLQLSTVEYSPDGGGTYIPLALDGLPFSFLAPGEGTFHLVARAIDTANQLVARDERFSIPAECQTFIMVPDVVGQDQTDAEAMISSSGLTVGAITLTNSDTVPKGTVIDQNPIGSTKVALGSAVNLVLSSGPALVTVPEVVGIAQADAEAAIVSANLMVGTVTTANSPTVPAGTLISQDPQPGQEVAPNSPVDLVVSLGPAPVPVPNVVGQTQTDAEMAITDRGLVVGNITPEPSDTVPKGSVIRQDPPAGQDAVPGSSINLVISSGPPKVTVPDVVGLSQADAEKAVTDAKLSVGPVIQQSSETVPDGHVISQNPKAGEEAEENSSVALVVSSGPPVILGKICSYLGDDPKPSFLDQDRFLFKPSRGEIVTFRLEKFGTVHSGNRATLRVQGQRVKGAKKRDTGNLPNEVKATFRTSRWYSVWVNEQPIFGKGERFRGQYCLTMEATDGAEKTLKPHPKWVEP